MELSVISVLPKRQVNTCLVIGVPENGKFHAGAARLDEASGGALGHVVKQGDMRGKIGETLLLRNIPGLDTERVLLVGTGGAKGISDRQFRKTSAAAAAAVRKTGAATAISCLADTKVGQRDMQWKSRQSALEALNSGYEFTLHSNKAAKASKTLKKWILICDPGVDAKAAKAGVKQAAGISTGCSLARDLGNLAPNICTPNYLANQAKSLQKTSQNFNTTVLDEAQMKKLGMGSLLSVSQGSRQPAKLICMEYKGAAKRRKPVVFVGKGITFDTGGISLKPGATMDEMKYDMCGAASVFGAMRACVELDLKCNLVCIVPAAENMPDGDASRPGDVVTSMSGQTIEILNTDAEGRLVLCDALSWSEKFKPAAVVDVATLTGACVVALGHVASALMANDQDLAAQLLEAGEVSGDRTWQLPMWDEYQTQLDSNFADMANIGGRAAGAVTAACFLSRFTKAYPWAHLDIAGIAWLTGKNKGATGRPVPLLVQYLLDNH